MAWKPGRGSPDQTDMDARYRHSGVSLLAAACTGGPSAERTPRPFPSPTSTSARRGSTDCPFGSRLSGYYLPPLELTPRRGPIGTSVRIDAEHFTGKCWPYGAEPPRCSSCSKAWEHRLGVTSCSRSTERHMSAPTARFLGTSTSPRGEGATRTATTRLEGPGFDQEPMASAWVARRASSGRFGSPRGERPEPTEWRVPRRPRQRDQPSTRGFPDGDDGRRWGRGSRRFAWRAPLTALTVTSASPSGRPGAGLGSPSGVTGSVPEASGRTPARKQATSAA
jgi:hypothetical protein